MKNVTVVISDNSKHAVADAKVQEWCESFLLHDTAYVATSLMFNELRIAVSRKEIRPFSFNFNGETLHVDSNGELRDGWPIGLFDHQAIQVKMLMSGKSREEVSLANAALKKRVKRPAKIKRLSNGADIAHSKPQLLFRPHRGGLEESMALTSEFGSASEFTNIISQRLFESDKSMVTIDALIFEPVGFDVRNGWNTYRICLKDYGVVGFTNVPLEDIPLPCTQSHIGD
ncbi:hypothetical protein VCHA53O466_50409 [Vibrio chagasii]|nr:hypothetical protein VCHA53O466_50409 [Vibrio chagasii]